MARSLPFHDGVSCIECGEPHRREPGSWRCWACDGAVQKARALAVRELKRTMASGAIPNPETLACHFCGGPARDYEHRNYLRPLDVKPACRSCNLMRGPAIWRPASTWPHQNEAA